MVRGQIVPCGMVRGRQTRQPRGRAGLTMTRLLVRCSRQIQALSPVRDSPDASYRAMVAGVEAECSIVGFEPTGCRCKLNEWLWLTQVQFAANPGVILA